MARQERFKLAGAIALLAAVACGLPLRGAEEPGLPEDAMWRPRPQIRTVPYHKNPLRAPRAPTRLAGVTLDGTFESYPIGAPISSLQDDHGNGTMMFGAGEIQSGGVGGRKCVFIPGGSGPTMGIEEKNAPLKPNAWYRVEMMVKGIPYMINFTYPREKPVQAGVDEHGRPVWNDYHNSFYIDSNHGGGYGFYYVCSACDFARPGTAEDGDWITGGFRQLPESCPDCGAGGSALYREGDRRPYLDWTLVYEDFRTGDYTGYYHNIPYYWHAIIIGSASDVMIDNFMVYEITGEGGEAVGGDELVDATLSGHYLPPLDNRPALEAWFGAKSAAFIQEAYSGVDAARRLVADELGTVVPRIRLARRPAAAGAAGEDGEDGANDLADNEAMVALYGREVARGAVHGAAEAVGLITAALRANAHHMLSIDDVRAMLERARDLAPVAVAEAERAMPLPQIKRVLGMLLSEGRSLRPLPRILEAIACEARDGQDPAETANRVARWLDIGR